MASIRRIVLANRPKENIVPGETFRTETKPAPKESDLKDGEVIYETLYLSVDPAMRGWLNDTRSYVPPVPIGGVMRGSSIGVIKASKVKGYPVGSYASSSPGWTEQAIVKEKNLQRLDVPRGAKLTDVLGVLGGTGLTAYQGLIDVAQVKAGDFVVVSGAAGATGSVVCQIAKLKGARVLGIAGSDEKVQWLKDLGCDDAVNYKDPNFKQDFRTKTKGFIDVFFDNVGGEILDLALARAKTHARFVMCGGISQYNKGSSEVIGPKNYLNIISQRIRMEGFIVLDSIDRWPKMRRELAQWLAEGKIKSTETVAKGGLEAAEKALAGLFEGKNTGKMMIEVKPPPKESAKASL